MENPKREPLKAGDDVTEEALVLEHTLRRVEVCETKEEAAKGLGINPKTITRRLHKNRQPFLKYPRGTEQRPPPAGPPDDAENHTDD